MHATDFVGVFNAQLKEFNGWSNSIDWFPSIHERPNKQKKKSFILSLVWSLLWNHMPCTCQKPWNQRLFSLLVSILTMPNRSDAFKVKCASLNISDKSNLFCLLVSFYTIYSTKISIKSELSTIISESHSKWAIHNRLWSIY